MDKIKKGKFGEKQALKYLVKKGYNIIDLNYYTRYGEIDIIATYLGVYIFVEVKTRSDAKFGTPAEAVSRVKQRKMSKTALDFIAKNDLFDTAVRFDVIEVFLETRGYNINHIQNAFDEVL